MTSDLQKSDVLKAAEFVADKLRWQQDVLCDTSLSPSARLFGGILMHDFDDRCGGAAWRSVRKMPRSDAAAPKPEDDYRARTGFAVRTIQLAARELERAGYIRTELSSGRGHSNRYFPLFGKANAASPFNLEKANARPPFDGQKAKFDARNGETQFAQLLQDSDIPPLSPQRPTASCSGGKSARTPCVVDADDRAISSAVLWVGVPPEVRGQVVGLLGESWARSWIDPCGWDADHLALIPRSPLARGRIQKDLGHHLAELNIQLGEPRGRSQ